MDDVLGAVPANGTDKEYEVLPAGAYPAILRDITIVDKPAHRLKGEEGEDLQQYEWRFGITDADYEDKELRAWTNRSWHPKANAHKYAAAIYGRALEEGEVVKKSLLVGQPCQLIVDVYVNKNGDERNAIRSLLPAKKSKAPTAQKPATDDVLGLRARLEAAKAVKAEGWDLGAQKRVYANLGGKTPFQELSAADQIKVVEAFEEAAGLTDIEF